MTPAERNARADARARALGWSSRSQQYRARKQGYRAEQAVAFRTATEAGRGRAAGLVRQRTAGGVVLSANTGDPRAVAALGRALGLGGGIAIPAGSDLAVVTAQVGNDGRVRFTFERTDGRVIHAGDKGGMSKDYLRKIELDDPYEDSVFDVLADLIEERSY